MSGKETNAGRGIAPTNHDGTNKYYINAGDHLPTGSGLNTTVLAEAGDYLHTVVGLMTMNDAELYDTVTVRGC